MAQQHVQRLRFPVGGVNRRYAYRQQPPFTCVEAVNVRADGTIEGRERGGSRPGLVKWADEQISGASNPIRMLGVVTVAKSTTRLEVSDNFDIAGSEGSLSTAWSQASWEGAKPEVTDNLANADTETGRTGVVYKSVDIDTSQPYSVAIKIVPYRGQFYGKYRMFARMDDTNPDVTNEGIVVELDMTGSSGDYDGFVRSYSGGVPTEYAFTAGTKSPPDVGWLKVLIDGNDITVTWRGTTVLSQTISAHTGKRVGFGLHATQPGGPAAIAEFRLFYWLSNPTYVARQEVVASANGELWRLNASGKMEKVTTDLTLASDRNIQCVERGQKLYIADYGDIAAEGTDGSIDATGLQLDATSISDWTTLGILPKDMAVVITDGTGDVVNGTYKISSVSADHVTLASSAGGAGTCSYRIERAPKVYDPATDTLSLWWPTAGEIPVGCPMIALYRDRLVLAGRDPYCWYMSRSGDPLDFEYSSDVSDYTRAIDGSNSDAGLLGAPIRAMVSFTDDRLLFGHYGEIRVMRGDPAYGGQIDLVSKNAGILDKQAFCTTPEGGLLFLSHDGLYYLEPGEATVPQPISPVLMPRELRNINAQTCTILMGYDADGHGAHICVSPTDSGTGTHWFFDWRNKSFWAQSFAEDHEPTAMLVYHSHLTNKSTLLFGCRDGYIRQFDFEANTDDGSAISSYVLYGPITLSPNDYENHILAELNADVAISSGDISWEIRRGDTAEEAMSADAAASGTWSAGRNTANLPRVRGPHVFLKLANADNVRWAVEQVLARTVLAGRVRKS